MIEPSQARYRMAHAFQRLANALGVQLLPTDEDCVCLERLATQAGRWAQFDALMTRPSREEITDERSPEDWENHRE